MDTTPFLIHELITALGAGATQDAATYLCKRPHEVGIRSLPRHYNSLSPAEGLVFETPLGGTAGELLWAIVEKLGFGQYSNDAELGDRYVVLHAASQWHALTTAIATAKQEIYWLEALKLPVDVDSIVINIMPWPGAYPWHDLREEEPDQILHF